MRVTHFLSWQASLIRECASPRQFRQDVYTHLLNGANMVEYWHWASIHANQETYWKGVLSHDLEPNRAYAPANSTLA